MCSVDPVKVPLSEPATQVACGDNHTVILLASGQVITFGKHQEGQLGRNKESDDDESWYMVPRQTTGRFGHTVYDHCTWYTVQVYLRHVGDCGLYNSNLSVCNYLPVCVLYLSAAFII